MTLNNSVVHNSLSVFESGLKKFQYKNIDYIKFTKLSSFFEYSLYNYFETKQTNVEENLNKRDLSNDYCFRGQLMFKVSCC